VGVVGWSTAGALAEGDGPALGAGDGAHAASSVSAATAAAVARAPRRIPIPMLGA
jgi:hypothetical protein